MTRVLHTADIHLTPDDQERMDALRSLLDLAEREYVSLSDGRVAAAIIRETA